MQTYSSDELRQLRRWEEDFLKGGHSLDAWALDALRNGVDEDALPLIFHVPRKLNTFQYLHEQGVDLLKRDPDGYTILHDDTHYDLPTFEWLAGVFQSLGAIDLAELEGLTPLSSHIKLGKLERANILLQHGASVNTFATISRYGGSRLDIPTQALYALAAKPEADQELSAIEALKLLKKFGLSLGLERKTDLLSRVSGKPKIRDWIERNF
jgi:ankyrin repeat protein